MKNTVYGEMEISLQLKNFIETHFYSEAHVKRFLNIETLSITSQIS